MPDPDENAPQPAASRPPQDRWRRAPHLACAAILCVAAAIRWRLLDVPLERDEGVYAYFGRALLEGVLPYTGVYGIRLPGIYALYAGIVAVFPNTPGGVHAALLLANGVTAFCVFGLARHLLGGAAAVVAVGTFALLSLTHGVQGAFANAEHFVLLFAVPSLWLLLRAAEREAWRGCAVAGVGLGLALLVKQHGAAFALCGGLWLLGHELRQRPRHAGGAALRLCAFAAGVVAPVLAVVLFYAAIGAFGDLWFWTVSYAREYAAPKPLDRALSNLRTYGSMALGAAPGVWALAALGALGVATHAQARRHASFLLLLLLCSLLAVTPGFVFRPHYFVLLLPAAALLAAVATCAAASALQGRLGTGPARIAVAAGLAALLLHTGSIGWRYLFTLPPEQIVRIAYPGNPFHESLEIARFVEAHTDPDDRVAILGSEPQIYFYAKRRAATGFVYVYPLMETHRFAEAMQRRMTDEIERADPEMLVFVRVDTSWLRRPDSPKHLETWLRAYLVGFELVGTMEMQPSASRFHTGPGLEALRTRTRSGVDVYRRIREAGRDGARGAPPAQPLS